MSAPNVESLKWVFYAIEPNRNKVSIPVWVSSSTIIEQRQNSVGDQIGIHNSFSFSNFEFIPASAVRRAPNIIGIPYRHKHDRKDYFSQAPRCWRARMIGAGRGYLGRRFTVIREAETGAREQPGLIEFEDGKREFYLPVKCDLSEGGRYRLDAGRIDTKPSGIVVFRIANPTRCGKVEVAP